MGQIPKVREFHRIMLLRLLVRQHMCLPKRRRTRRTRTGPFINGAQSQRPNGRKGEERKGGKEGQTIGGIFHLKALLSYRSSIKTEREEICENGFTKFPSLSMNSLSIEHYERQREKM